MHFLEVKDQENKLKKDLHSPLKQEREKAKQYLQRTTKKIQTNRRTDTKEKWHYKVTQQSYSSWLTSYGECLCIRAEHCSMISDEDDTFQMTDTILRTFKTSTEECFTKGQASPIARCISESAMHPNEQCVTSIEKKVILQHQPHLSTSSLNLNASHPRRTEAGGISTRMAALKKKHELELAKVKLRLQEQELYPNHHVLDQFEQWESGRSQLGRSTSQPFVHKTPQTFSRILPMSYYLILSC